METKKIKFEEPLVEIIVLNEEDNIITSSGTFGSGYIGDNPVDYYDL